MSTSSQGPQVDYQQTDPSPRADASQRPADGAFSAPLNWPDEAGVKIALWGPTHSGKTTFLGALFLAPERLQGFGTWNIIPLNHDSSRFQADIVKRLEKDHCFPEATLTLQKPLAWRFVGDLRNAPHVRHGSPFSIPDRLRGRGWNRPGDSTTFTLHIQDLPGEVYDFEKEDEKREAIIQHLAEADAIVYLHDPIRDADGVEDRTVRFFRDMLQALQFHNRDRLIDGRLHHHVAACVTKFDHPKIYRKALKETFAVIDPEPPHAPRVTDENGRAFFNWICQEHSSEGVDLVRSALEFKFLPKRVRYYATSAIGFYETNRRVDLENCNNLGIATDPVTKKTVNGIQGPLHPINVLEPLVNLVMDVQRSKSGRTRG